jgi:hypothetical protein
MFNTERDLHLVFIIYLVSCYPSVSYQSQSNIYVYLCSSNTIILYLVVVSLLLVDHVKVCELKISICLYDNTK